MLLIIAIIIGAYFLFGDSDDSDSSSEPKSFIKNGDIPDDSSTESLLFWTALFEDDDK